MAEIIYRFPGSETVNPSPNIRWLSRNDLPLFNEHLTLCGQRNLEERNWNEIYEEGTIYCLLFADGVPTARACVEKYSDDAWEVADVRVAQAFRNRGFAYWVCSWVLGYILEHGKIATIRTEEDNNSMQRVIDKLGFVPATDKYN